MFTAKFNRTEETAQGTRFFVDFTNGTETFTEACIPQDKVGFDYWLKGRLDAMNTAEELKAQLTIGAEIVVPQTDNSALELSEEEQAFITWCENNRALENTEKLMKRATEHNLPIDPVLAEQIQTLAETVNSTFKAEYVWRL